MKRSHSFTLFILHLGPGSVKESRVIKDRGRALTLQTPKWAHQGAGGRHRVVVCGKICRLIGIPQTPQNWGKMVIDVWKESLWLENEWFSSKRWQPCEMALGLSGKLMEKTMNSKFNKLKAMTITFSHKESHSMVSPQATGAMTLASLFPNMQRSCSL